MPTFYPVTRLRWNGADRELDRIRHARRGDKNGQQTRYIETRPCIPSVSTDVVYSQRNVPQPLTTPRYTCTILTCTTASTSSSPEPRIQFNVCI